MKYSDLRDFVQKLSELGELQHLDKPVSIRLEMTELADRVLRADGPALMFDAPVDGERRFAMPVLANLFGTPRRVALGMGAQGVEELRGIGEVLAYLKEPEPPRGLRDAWDKLPMLRQVLAMAPRQVRSAPCQEIVLEGADIDLASLPVQTCWPGDAGPLITWGLVVTAARSASARTSASTASRSSARTGRSCAG